MIIDNMQGALQQEGPLKMLFHTNTNKPIQIPVQLCQTPTICYQTPTILSVPEI